MTSRRNKLLLKMLGTTTGETEEKLLKLPDGGINISTCSIKDLQSFFL